MDSEAVAAGAAVHHASDGEPSPAEQMEQMLPEGGRKPERLSTVSRARARGYFSEAGAEASTAESDCEDSTFESQAMHRERDHHRVALILKLAMSCIMCLAAALGGWLAFRLGARSELLIFERQYEDSVLQLSYSLQHGLSAKAAVGAECFAFRTPSALTTHDPPPTRFFSTAAASYFASAGSTFPNASFPGLNAIAAHLVQVSTIRGIAWLPLVLPSQLRAYEEFANQTLGSQWADATPAQAGYASLAAMQAGINVTTRNIHGGVFGGTAAAHAPLNASALYYFPLIHEAPLATNEPVINYDLNSERVRERAISAVMATKAPQTTDWLRLVQDTRLSLNRIASLALTPVLVNGTVVGLGNTVFNWDSVLEASLPSFIQGIDCVLSSGLSNRTFTMRITGGTVLGLGEGDLHSADPELERYQRVVNATLGTTWTLTIYPTHELMNGYLSSGPRNRMIAVVVVIAFCLCIFLLHDWLARSRSVLLVRLIQATSRIVDDVFPSNIRVRMVRKALKELEPVRSPRAASEGEGTSRALGLIQKWVGMEQASLASQRRRSHVLAAHGDIAETFHATTILFSDVVGFTAWSSSVSPERVFSFLGAMFHAFDQLAARLGIFKVETIGDSYMCVCGLPEPTAQHAERMADFSIAMLEATRAVCANMGVDLSLRVGMHSGSVTAGVLMGERARFQLFGDAVNTASRMESTGTPGRVQCSEATARLLQDAETFDLEYRGKTAAKGKGEMDTYWLVGRSSGTPFVATGLPRKKSDATSYLHLAAGQTRGSTDDGPGSSRRGGSSLTSVLVDVPPFSVEARRRQSLFTDHSTKST